MIQKNKKITFRLGANINRNISRHYMGRVFVTGVNIILKEPVYDSQCGAKLIFPNYFDMVYEHPLTNWTEVNGVKLKFKDFLYAPIELFLIWKNYRKFIKNALPTKAKLH